MSDDHQDADKVSLQETLMQLNKKNVWIVPSLAAGITFVLVSALMAGVMYQTKSISSITRDQSNKTTHILTTLQDMDAQLQMLSTNPSHSRDFNTALNTIHSDLSELQKSVSTRGDITKVSTQLSSMQDDIDTQMGDLKKEVAGSTAKSYLDANVLPFKVISIDVISQQPFVTVDYEQHQSPLGVGDSLAGWKITDADYQNGFVEFENAKEQYVKVNLQGSSQ